MARMFRSAASATDDDARRRTTSEANGGQRSSGRRRTGYFLKCNKTYVKFKIKIMQLNLFLRAPDLADRRRHAVPIDERLERERQEKIIHVMSCRTFRELKLCGNK